MRIYVLEDDPERIVALCRYFDRLNATIDRQATQNHYHEVQWSQTCGRRDEFKPPYDLILLDHDLGGRQMRDHEDCVMTFLTSIREEIGDALVIIHSHNLGAAARMKQFYPLAVLAPFNDIKFWTVLNAAMRTPS